MKNKLARYTSKVKEITNFIFYEFIDVIWKELQDEEPYKYIYTLIFKTHNALDTANILLCNISNKPTTTDSLFLIFRAIISDLIIYDYLIHISKNDELLRTNIKRMYFDHLDRTIIGMRRFYRSANKANETEVEQRVSNLKNRYTEYFYPDGTPIYEGLNLTVSSITGKIFSETKKDSELDHLLIARDLYDKFSKYEHFGLWTFELTHRQFDSKNTDSIFNEAHEAIEVSLYYINRLVRLWIDADNEKIEKFTLLRKELRLIKK